MPIDVNSLPGKKRLAGVPFAERLRRQCPYQLADTGLNKFRLAIPFQGLAMVFWFGGLVAAFREPGLAALLLMVGAVLQVFALHAFADGAVRLAVACVRISGEEARKRDLNVQQSQSA